MVVASVTPGQKAVQATVVVPTLSDVVTRAGPRAGPDRSSAAVLLPSTLATTPEVHSTITEAIEASVTRYRES